MDRVTDNGPSDKGSADDWLGDDAATAGVWIFGYGSLMWKPGFDHLTARHALLHGYHRSLCIYSWVHRGTRERPGLVFGLDRGGACKGFAFNVATDDEADVIDYLDARELVTDVYRRKRLMITLENGRVLAWCYVVRRDHPQYAGRLPEDELLKIIENSEGRSGHCRDYVLSTVAHLEALGVNDATLKSVSGKLLNKAA
ncbi:MAG: gamma-glutamylcyclotransferase [Geminicoccaceae bacterium]